MEFYTLASGSSGNCALLRTGGAVLLFDAGISCRRIEQSLRTLGLTLADLTAVFLTHEHADHISGLTTLCKKCSAPIYASRGMTHLLACPAVPFTAGGAVALEGCTVRTFSTSHDAVDPVGYRVDGPDGSFGLLTDTGYVTDAAAEALDGVDLLLLEANHDVETLQYGPYPYFLKRRILGDEGHLSNDAAAEFACRMAQRGTRQFVLVHLSRENNTPARALNTVGYALRCGGFEDIRLTAAPRGECSEAYIAEGAPCRR